jgi:hypothetical protein
VTGSRGSSSVRLAIAVVLAVLVVASCNPTPPTSAPVTAMPAGPGATSAGRPSSPAVIAVVSPIANAVVTGRTVHVVVQLTGANVIAATTNAVRPDEGHVHLYLDNSLVYMQYSLSQDLPVSPGTYVLRAEFVASDHAPFNPRVWSTQVFFTVK